MSFKLHFNQDEGLWIYVRTQLGILVWSERFKLRPFSTASKLLINYSLGFIYGDPSFSSNLMLIQPLSCQLYPSQPAQECFVFEIGTSSVCTLKVEQYDRLIIYTLFQNYSFVCMFISPLCIIFILILLLLHMLTWQRALINMQTKE